ncbi:MAG: hypothetical protein HOC23_13480 [Halieaceae bacterium]|jgi:hypothetical protein|nr:hypothetical protein [Halieaceae bacterium]
MVLNKSAAITLLFCCLVPSAWSDVILGFRDNWDDKPTICQVGKGINRNQAEQNFNNSGFTGKTTIEVHCPTGGWYALVKKSGLIPQMSCGMVCGQSSRKAAIEAATDYCNQHDTGPGSCTSVTSAFDDGKTYESEELTGNTYNRANWNCQVIYDNGTRQQISDMDCATGTQPLSGRAPYCREKPGAVVAREFQNWDCSCAHFTACETWDGPGDKCTDAVSGDIVITERPNVGTDNWFCTRPE